jgi:polysaccharide deacetylase 2 family uncharacterized protein YibQ
MAEDETPIVTDQIEPAPAGGSLRSALGRMPALGIGVLAIGAILGTTIAALTLLGSAADGNPTVSLKLTPPARGPLETAAPGHTLSFVDSRAVGGNLVVDPALIEDAAEGPLPVIARDGRMPMTAYAQAFDKNDKRPKIAAVITGLGVGATATDLALAKLPPQVTFAFAPFAPDAQSYVDKARGLGHEVLLAVPMEPFDFPESDPGPHALLVGATAEENIKRLNWAMSRFTGYVGIANLLGGRFLGEAGAIEPVLTEATKRGLLFFDDGASSRSLAVTGSRHANATIATGTLILDQVQTPAAIDSKLVQLEAQARQDGFAIGVASRYPVTIARLSEWAAAAGTRGFQLVPLSALAARPPASASASTR